MSSETLVTIAPFVTFALLAAFFAWVWVLEFCIRVIERRRFIQSMNVAIEQDTVETQPAFQAR